MGSNVKISPNIRLCTKRISATRVSVFSNSISPWAREGEVEGYAINITGYFSDTKEYAVTCIEEILEALDASYNMADLDTPERTDRYHVEIVSDGAEFEAHTRLFHSHGKSLVADHLLMATRRHQKSVEIWLTFSCEHPIGYILDFLRKNGAQQG